jgi:Rifampin ADP-ribosyl transferase
MTTDGGNAQLANCCEVWESAQASPPSGWKRQSEPMADVDTPSPRIFYHGTRADLEPGDLIVAGYSLNYGSRTRVLGLSDLGAHRSTRPALASLAAGGYAARGVSRDQRLTPDG